MARKKEPTFEESMNRLREIVQMLEQGTLPLKETIEAYEEGRGLAKTLEKMLLDGEKRIEMMNAEAEIQDITDEMPEAKEG